MDPETSQPSAKPTMDYQLEPNADSEHVPAMKPELEQTLEALFVPETKPILESNQVREPAPTSIMEVSVLVDFVLE